MKRLVESVVMDTLGEAKQSKVENVVGVYVGRFQPFHAGHFNTYNEMVKEFGKSNVFIATSNVSGGDRHPFNFKEKLFACIKFMRIEIQNNALSLLMISIIL